jgi:heme/copper-type cytochrome/quinol oxidase subunit 2
MDEILDAELTIKAIGSQWFWSYEYSDYSVGYIGYDSFMLDDLSLFKGDFRLLTVDNYLVLPINTSIRILVSSNDVIHAFAVPSLALKCDAIPGRLNALGLIINRPSTFTGQCSELCGVNHGFMPIGIHAVTFLIDSYINFISYSYSFILYSSHYSQFMNVVLMVTRTSNLNNNNSSLLEYLYLFTP